MWYHVLITIIFIFAYFVLHYYGRYRWYKSLYLNHPTNFKGRSVVSKIHYDDEYEV